MASIEWKGKLTMTNEEIISGFLRTAYTDERLAMLLAHAESERLAFFSCCCFAGVPTAKHALQGQMLAPNAINHGYAKGHKADTESLQWAAMSSAFCALGDDDIERRAKLIPLIHAEMQRRKSLRAQVEVPEMVTV